MKIDVLDINEMVETEDLKEVSNAVYFNAGSLPTSDGLFSTEIFGEVGSEERRRNFAYISLNGKFLQPIVYKILTTLDHKIESIIAGNNYYSIDGAGNLVEDPNGDTGLDFLYNNYERIIFKSSDSEQRRTKLKLLAKLKKDEVFIDKFVVIPASLRDYNPSKVSGSRISDVDPLNELYVRIIRAASNLTNSSFSFVTNTSKMQIQLTLVEIYSMLTELLAHKNGIIRKRLMGKSVDYATRSVITAPRFTTDKWEDNPIKFGYTGIPLSQVAVLLYPFFVKYIEDFIELHKESFTRIKKKNGEVIIIDDIEQQFSDKNINKMIDNYIKNIEGRFDSLKVKDKTGTYHNVDVYREDLNRQFTFTDLLYIAAIDICEDKHVYVTRYPVENFQNIYPSKIKVLSTKNTTSVELEDRFLKDYPIIYPNYPTNEDTFVDSTRINNSYTASLGADYDGDTVSIRALYSTEANIEADSLINSKTMILSQTGQTTRKLGNEAVLSLFSLSRN